jgi:succinyl-CoA synthetase alpha subunit
MSILVDRETTVICQGITGKAGSFHTAACLEYGTKIIGGVSPGKGGTKSEHGLPVFDTCHDAVAATGADVSMVFVPAPFAADAIMEAADAVMPGYIHKPARNGTKSVGIISRSGTLTYEAVWQCTTRGIAQSTCIGIGGDPVKGLNFIELLDMFEKDEKTDAIILIGEIGGTDEEATAKHIERHITKPVVAFIAGRTAPPGKRMGHAGAIISGGEGTADSKIAALKNADVAIAESPAMIGETLAGLL